MALALSVQHMTSNLKPLPLKELYAPEKGGEDANNDLCTLTLAIHRWVISCQQEIGIQCQ